MPVTAWFDSNDRHDIQQCHEKLTALMHAAGFELSDSETREQGITEYMMRSVKKLSLQGLYESIDQISRCFGNQPCGNMEIQEAGDAFRNQLQHLPSFAVKIGALLILKQPSEGVESPIITRKMSISGLIHFDKNPGLICEPARLAEEIRSLIV